MTIFILFSCVSSFSSQNPEQNSLRFSMEPANFDVLFNIDGYLKPFEHEIRRR